MIDRLLDAFGEIFEVQPLCSPIDSIVTLMTVWSIWGKIIRTTIIVSYICIRIMEFLHF